MVVFFRTGINFVEQVKLLSDVSNSVCSEGLKAKISCKLTVECQIWF